MLPVELDFLRTVVDWPGILILLVFLALVIFALAHIYRQQFLWILHQCLRFSAAIAGILIFNGLLGSAGLHIGLNPWNIFIIALLGLPGLGLLIYLQQSMPF